MTRINVIDPKYLTDQHVMAEYRELPMVISSLRRSLASKRGLPKIPENYTLNAGHVTFFYSRGRYLQRRYQALICELTNRGYSLDPARPVDFSIFTDNNMHGDWQPTNADVLINANRIAQRILQKPHWYKYNRLSIVSLSMYEQLIHPLVVWSPS